MKTFRWDLVASNNGDIYYWLSERDEQKGFVWGSLVSKGDKYQLLVLHKTRTGWSTIEELLDLVDAKEAIEKKLFDDDIIQEGDTVEDYTIP